MDREIKYGVIPTRQGFEELFAGLEAFLTEHKFFRCSEVAFESTFVKIRAFHEQMKGFQTIYVPIQFVAYVIEEGDQPLIGFRFDPFKSRSLNSDPGATLPPDD